MKSYENHRKTIGKPQENCVLMGFNGDQYPLVMTDIAMQKLQFLLRKLTISMAIFNSYVCLPEGNGCVVFLLFFFYGVDSDRPCRHETCPSLIIGQLLRSTVGIHDINLIVHLLHVQMFVTPWFHLSMVSICFH